MTAAEHTYTVTGFAESLLALSRAYLEHFDPGAPTDAFAVRLEVTGPNLNLVFDQRGDEGPNLTISLRNVASGVTLDQLPMQDDSGATAGWRETFKRGPS